MNSYMVWGKGYNMIKLAIDLGSSVTKMYRADTNSGIVLAEPSCVAVTGEENQIKAIGKEAKNLIGKTAEYTRNFPPYKTSMLVDCENIRPLEVDAIVGRVVKYAQKFNIAVPHLQTVYAILKAFDTHRKNSGLYKK